MARGQVLRTVDGVLPTIHNTILPHRVWRVRYDAAHSQLPGRLQRGLGYRLALRVHLGLLARDVLLGQEHAGRVVRRAKSVQPREPGVLGAGAADGSGDTSDTAAAYMEIAD